MCNRLSRDEGGDTSDDFGLSAARMLRLADGPDEVHRDQIAYLEYKRQANSKTGGALRDMNLALNSAALGPNA